VQNPVLPEVLGEFAPLFTCVPVGEIGDARGAGKRRDGHFEGERAGNGEVRILVHGELYAAHGEWMLPPVTDIVDSRILLRTGDSMSSGSI
jgi:hypothetical protein